MSSAFDSTGAALHKPRTFVVVSHTHWDREWYLPFEAFRARLVRMMDALLERDPEYKHFVLDGQTVPLDDYLHTPGAQLQGRWKFQYSLIPHRGGWEKAYWQAHNFVRPLRAVRVSGGDGTLPPSGSVLAIEPPEVILSTLKPAEDGDGVVARVYNIASEPATGKVRLHAPHGRVERTNLNEEEPNHAVERDGQVELTLRTNEIATLMFKEA